MLYQLVLFILIGCAWDIQAQRGGCPQYEEWSWCPPACHGDGCTPTNHVTRCIQACDQQPRCVCRRGYFRQNGVCVRKRQCQMFSNTYFEQFQRLRCVRRPPRYPDEMVPGDFTNRCRSRCPDFGRPTPCSEVNELDCYCPVGYCENRRRQCVKSEINPLVEEASDDNEEQV